MSITSTKVKSVELEMFHGLNKDQKSISSKFFYDDNGSRLFQMIMDTSDYYPTDCEREILEDQREQILSAVQNSANGFDIVELGAGDGQKLLPMLESMWNKYPTFRYYPIDISDEALRLLSSKLKAQDYLGYVSPLHGDYFEMMDELKNLSEVSKLFLFLGSNIGNYDHQAGIELLKSIRQNATKNDHLLVGYDLKKDAEIIYKAYNDSEGYTRAFNLNLLTRMNRELGANFDLDQFMHEPVYDEQKGEARSYLKSRIRQKVWFEAINQHIEFEKDELIHTEISRKYDLETIEKMGYLAGFEVVEHFQDSRGYFVNTLFKATK